MTKKCPNKTFCIIFLHSQNLLYIIIDMLNTISRLFLETRKSYGESQTIFSKRLGCSRVTLSMYETGDCNPGADKYEKLLQLRALLKTGQGAQ